MCSTTKKGNDKKDAYSSRPSVTQSEETTNEIILQPLSPCSKKTRQWNLISNGATGKPVPVQTDYSTKECSAVNEKGSASSLPPRKKKKKQKMNETVGIYSRSSYTK